MYVYKHISIHIHIYLYMNIYLYIHICIYVYIHSILRTMLCTCVYLHVCTHTHIHIQAHTYVYIYYHIQTNLSALCQEPSILSTLACLTHSVFFIFQHFFESLQFVRCASLVVQGRVETQIQLCSQTARFSSILIIYDNHKIHKNMSNVCSIVVVCSKFSRM